MKECRAIGPNLKTYYYYTNEMADNSEAKGVIVIATGIEGTGALYDEIGDYLDSKGFAMYAIDELGYGKTGKVQKKIYKSWNSKSFHFASYNIHALSVFAKSKHQNVPLYLIGNDFGAMLSLYLIREFPEVVDKVVTIGWGAPRARDFGLFFRAWIRKLFLFDENASKGAHRAENSGLGLRFERGEKYAWLSSDENQVKKIKDAKFIDEVGTVGHYFHYNARRIRTPYFMRMKKTDRTTPMLFVSGAQDLFTGRGLSTKVLEKFYKSRKFTNVESLIVEGRHELLFETNRFENVDTILNWLTNNSTNMSEVKNDENIEISIVGAKKEEVIYEEKDVEVVDVQVHTNNHMLQEAEEDLLIKINKEQK